MYEDLIKTINEHDSCTTNIHINHFDSNHYTTQKDYFDNTQDDNQVPFNENELQSSSQLKDQNETNDLKTTNKYEGGLVMTYDNIARNNTLHPRTFYALYIGQNNKVLAI